MIDLELTYNPLDEEGEEGEGGGDADVEFIGLIERPLECENSNAEQPYLLPKERIKNLLASLPAQKKIVLGIIGFCREPQRPQAVDDFTSKLQRTNTSVYTPVTLRQLLEEAGALVYVDAPDAAGADSSTPPKQDEVSWATANPSLEQELCEQSSDEPQYLVVTKRPEGTWTSTQPALEILDAIDEMADLRVLLGVEEEYFEIFIRILRYCAEEPRSKSQLNDLVDSDPLLQKPRRYSGFFIDKLNDCGAIEWKPGWNTTSVGLDLLRELGQQNRGED
jgi:hypothetical protein